MAKIVPSISEESVSSTTSRGRIAGSGGSSHLSPNGHAHLQLGHLHSDKHGSMADSRKSVVNAVQSEYRHFIKWSGWYDSATCVTIRRFLRGHVFSAITILSLFVALFCADIFIMCGSETNTVLDVIVMIVMLIFGFEFFGLAATDASYIFSFFFWMDLLGTLSMIFDISFMLGPDATAPERYSGSGAEENVIYMRAARAAKLGARAGRLSRVMKLLRFLPFVNSQKQESNVKMARVISAQLTNVLSTRVAFLTLSIVVVLPCFGMVSYPETDDSMSTWAELLESSSMELHKSLFKVPANYSEAAQARIRLDREVTAYAAFYEDLSYGPFSACYGYRAGGADSSEVDCQPDSGLAILFNTTFRAPARRNFIRILSSGNFVTAFDLSTPKQIESISNVSMIVFVIIVMCVFGMVTSNSITVIALHPLERMLGVVRERCKEIFKYTNDLQEDGSDSEGEEEEYDDSDQSSEFALLERVVGKLAAIAHLSNTKDEPEVKEGMTEDEVMTLNWMQGTQVPAHKRRPSQMPGGAHDEVTDVTDHEKRPSVHASRLLDGLSSDIVDQLHSPHFSTIDLKKDDMQAVAAYIAMNAEGSSAWVRQTVQEAHLFKFVAVCDSKYQANPFHNFAHALDVQYACARQLRLIQADEFLPDSSQFWLLIASIAHDLGHTGVNNQYLIETSHAFAVKYNDRSPLENMHCATLFQVVSDPAANVFSGVEKDHYKEIRKGIIAAILHTDVTKHNEMMKELVMLYQMNSEVFDLTKTQGMSPDVAEVLQNNNQLTLNSLLHCSDVGNPMKPWDLAQRLAHLCVDEFFAQGDLEKAAGMAVQMLNDREKVNRPNSQIGFIEFVIAPMVDAMVHLFPTLDGMADNLGANISHWFDIWVEQVKPSEEVKAKTEARVRKVFTRCGLLMREIDDISTSQSSRRE